MISELNSHVFKKKNMPCLAKVFHTGETEALNTPGNSPNAQSSSINLPINHLHTLQQTSNDSKSPCKSQPISRPGRKRGVPEWPRQFVADGGGPISPSFVVPQAERVRVQHGFFANGAPGVISRLERLQVR